MQIAEKSAGINPDNYFDLAQLYRDNHQDDKAAAAYQEWYDKAPDRVEVSNSIEWLVNYYYDHGQPDKAMAIAKDAAEVYSAGGLETMMHLQEKMGNLAEAESYGQKVQERYNDTSALASFYKRHADKGDPGFQAKFDQPASTVFPNGMKKVALADLSGPPAVGISFSKTSDSMRAFGLSSDQIIMARLDGYGVANQAQYMFIRSLSDSPLMALHRVGRPNLPRNRRQLPRPALRRRYQGVSPLSPHSCAAIAHHPRASRLALRLDQF